MVIIMKIGIVARRNNIDYFIHRSYINLIKDNKYGIVTIDSNLNEYDAFIIPGGYDIDSKYYNEQNIACNNIDNEMDLLDKKVINYSIKNKIPLLGICRGIQSINVFLGGSLKQDILNHNNENHFIKYNNKYYLVNSFHHQSIKVLGDNLEIKALSIDNEIEIIKHKYLPILGVQFHPEIALTSISDEILKFLIYS